jgi:two-component system, OmpR family, osmolarity sensor histidine kinase EnvZ
MTAFKSLVPRTLYGRAALILILPIVAIQLVVTMAFLQRHFDGVTRQMTESVATEINHVMGLAARSMDDAKAQAKALDMELIAGAEENLSPSEDRGALDLTGRGVISTLRDKVAAPVGRIDLVSIRKVVRLTVASSAGPLEFQIERRRVSASNPHQLLVLMIVTGIVFTLVAYAFLRNQLRPITRLAEAAAAFGRGRNLPYRPRGAQEVRAAGAAFLDMRARIERQIEQRTLMLSGVSHDLRTPLTRMRLELSMLPQSEEVRHLTGDVAEMERLVEEFLAFARGDALEGVEEVDPKALAEQVIASSARMGGQASLGPVTGTGLAKIRPQAVQRALDNLVGNALRHGKRAVLSVAITDRLLRYTVEDDGPGIPADQRDEALRPFARLSEGRDPNKGGGVGLGLAIAADIASSHGGSLRLGESKTLGGLKVELDLAR